MVGILFYACMALMFLFSVPIWRRIYDRYSQNQPALETRPQLASPMGLVDLIVLLSIWLASQFFAVGLFTQVTGVEMSELESVSGSQMMVLMLIAGIGQLIGVALGMALLIIRYKDLRVIGWYEDFTRADLKLAFYGFLLIAPVVLVVQTLLSLLVEYKHPAMDAMMEDATAFTIFAVWVAAVISAPIAEEIIFRGWIQNWLQRISFRPGNFAASITGGWDNQRDPEWNQAIDQVESVLALEERETESGESVSVSNANLQDDSTPYAATSHAPLEETRTSANHIPQVNVPAYNSIQSWTAIVLTSLLFALMHLGQGLAPIPLFGMSILLGYLYQRTGSLLPCIGLHMLNNGYSVFWLTMQILAGETADLP